MLLTQLLYSLPVPLLVFLVVGLCVILAISGLLLTRRLVPFSTLQENNEFQEFLFSGIGIFYAVLLAFVVFDTSDRFTRTREIVEEEANKVGDLIRNAQGFSDPFRSQMHTRLREYSQAVLDDWDQTTHRQIGLRERDAIDQLWLDYQSFEPTTEREKVMFAEGLRRLSELRELRRVRLLRAELEIPAILWFVLLVGAVFTVCSTYFLGMRNLRAQVALTAIQTSTIVLILLVIFVFDHAYLGDVRVTPEAFELQLQEVQRLMGP